jgi:hypothetical protein
MSSWLIRDSRAADGEGDAQEETIATTTFCI